MRGFMVLMWLEAPFTDHTSFIEITRNKWPSQQRSFVFKSMINSWLWLTPISIWLFCITFLNSYYNRMSSILADYQKMLLTLIFAMFVADIMGEVSSINTVFDNENHSIHHMFITIQLDRYKTNQLIYFKLFSILLVWLSEFTDRPEQLYIAHSVCLIKLVKKSDCSQLIGLQERHISFSLQIKTGLEPATIASLCLLISLKFSHLWD